ncbi:MAG: outer membrane protein, partial [Glaciecola sp.]
ERVKNTLANETQQAYANAIAALNQYKSTEKSVEVFERNFDNAQKRFENGLINSTEFNAAKTQMQNQQFQMISSKYEYIFRMKIMELYQGKKIILE